MGVRVKPEHVNRHVQPVSDRFFYWLRATTLETRRVGYWWAERMLDTHRPLEEKMALFWHGHFATAQSKVRDYRKMLLQIEMFERHATGNYYIAWAQVFRTLIPTPRGAARINLTQVVLDSGSTTTGEAVDCLLGRFLRMPVSSDTRDALVALLDAELGTSDLIRARTYLEDPLRMVTHLIMSTPEYQIG